jgi:uncharacterized protein (DUF1499 family)
VKTRSAMRPAARALAATARGLVTGVLLLCVAMLALLAAGRAGWLAGTPPDGLGLQQGRLAPPATTPNSVSSQARLWPDHPRREQAHIDPLPAPDRAAWQQLQAVVTADPLARVVQREPDYLRVEYRTRWLGFVDDAEFAWDAAAGVVHVRSASRVGHGDLGKNRQRVQALRAGLQAQGPQGRP